MLERALPLIAGAVVACGAPALPGANVGVRERVVATIPSEHVVTLPARPPRPGQVRFGLAGGTSFRRRPRSSDATAGAEVEPAAVGEAYVAIGMPGRHVPLDGSAQAGWELVAGATAAPTPAARAAGTDPTLAVVDRAVVGGSLGVTGAFGDRDVTLAAGLFIRDVRIPFVWDYGDCVGGPSCPTWMRKGGPVEDTVRVIGVAGAAAVRRALRSGLGLMVGGGFDAAPSFEVSQRATVLCDGNGACEDDRVPETPTASRRGLAYVMLGLEAAPTSWSRVSMKLVPLTTGDPKRPQMQLGVEASF